MSESACQVQSGWDEILSYNSLSEISGHFDGEPLLGTLDDVLFLAGGKLEMMQFSRMIFSPIYLDSGPQNGSTGCHICCAHVPIFWEIFGEPPWTLVATP